jgi:hypothetical protein
MKCILVVLCLSIFECRLSLGGGVGTGADPGFNAQEHTNKTLTTSPFGNTCEANEVSPEVEARVVVGLKCMQS